MAKEKHLKELFHDTLKDIYFAEKKILGALPKMAKAAQSEQLKAAFAQVFGQLCPRPGRAQDVVVPRLIQQPLQQAEGHAGDAGRFAANRPAHQRATSGGPLCSPRSAPERWRAG